MAQTASLTSASERSLLDDWRLRRDKLLESGVHDALKSVLVRVLDFLIKRYDGTPEGNLPARFPLQSTVRFDRRAIVVHHHLGIGKVAGIKSASEASGRAAKLTANIRSMQIQESLKPVSGRIPIGISQPKSPQKDNWDPIETMEAAGKCLLGIFIFLACATAGCLPVALMILLSVKSEYLICLSIALSALLFVAMFGAACHISEKRLANLPDVPPPKPEEPLDRRPQLADADPAVRVNAIWHIGRQGMLDDVGLLSDLLALPPQEDEDPRERIALAKAIESISQRQPVNK